MKLFGDRVALVLVDEEYEGLLVPSPTAHKQYVLSRIVATGAGCSEVKLGDIVLWQNNGIIERQCRYKLNNQYLFVLLRSNLVARLTSHYVKLKNFQILSEYCLVRKTVEQPSKLITVPDSAQETHPDMVLRFYLEQKGSEVPLDIKPGDELILDRSTANPIELDGEAFCYIHRNYILGVVGE